MKHIDRRKFIKGAAAVIGGSMLPSVKAVSNQTNFGDGKLVKVINGEPDRLVETALDALGGIGSFIDQDDKVVVKPNIGFDRRPEQGANTNPEVVAALVRSCLEAGAKEVEVFDYGANNPKPSYKNSGIEEAARNAGAKVSYIDKRLFTDVKIPKGQVLKKWKFYIPALEADKYMNVPVLKHHSFSGITSGMKNIMGIIGGKRFSIHDDFDRKIVDLCTVVKPVLTIVDATRIMRRNGPNGGSVSDLDETRSMIAGTDFVAVEAASADLFGLDPVRIGYIMHAHDRGLGNALAYKNIRTIDLNG